MEWSVNHSRPPSPLKPEELDRMNTIDRIQFCLPAPNPKRASETLSVCRLDEINAA